MKGLFLFCAQKWYNKATLTPFYEKNYINSTSANVGSCRM